jgi:hypothetical protein
MPLLIPFSDFFLTQTMQGISVIPDANGQPAVLTIDLQRLDPTDSPLVAALLNRINNEPPAPERRTVEMAETVEQERAEWRLLAHTSLNRAYGDDEPDYDDVPALNPTMTHE